MVAVVVLVGTGLGWKVYRGVTASITQSSALGDAGIPQSVGKDMNVLIMGLDSRLDEKGNALPADIYAQLHAGDGTVGGYNSNVLILLHIPGDGSKATAISIPRDDYVDLVGACGAGCEEKGKIKEAYGDAFAIENSKLSGEGVTDQGQLESKSREAGRKAEIQTVRRFLGGVPIDHFIEITLVAFYEIANVVQPIEVCVNEDTEDSYSGAHFHKGVQWINGRQSVAFVRQRRDPNTDLNFTDLDRDRRQQAFLISLSKKLAVSGTLTDLGKLQALLNVASANIAVDYNPDLAMLAKTATKLTGGNVTFYTLPLRANDPFGQTPTGEDVNFVDLDVIHALVKKLIGSGSNSGSGSSSNDGAEPAPPTIPASIPSSSGTVLNVVNSSTTSGLAAQLERSLADHGFSEGEATSGDQQSDSSIEYGSGAQDAAQQLSSVLNVSDTEPSSDLASNVVRLTVGSDFNPTTGLLPPGFTLNNSGSTSTAAPVALPTAVDATNVGANAPAPTDLSSLHDTATAGAEVPCVK